MSKKLIAVMRLVDGYRNKVMQRDFVETSLRQLLANKPVDIEQCRADFEKWYCEDAAKQGYLLVEGIAHLRDGNHYGQHRTMLNGKWQGWQAAKGLTP